uniref:Tryptophan synthase beta chain-like PALP domain-containing protein n=1 Tax=Chromera velia CCMP2878 TaxID=1169474 RepID=A0A0G4EZF2_9ALVE|eukprot:Cvel_14306.t1-p1 / transcript=Cvel_14306.t1 / gene=Cvel_14306 / organism=Chromera_velia_CCMP2878 / gene_product=Cysteine synthase 2, putative / transcript_product=Cysteine synthase 2, putative / location=Cvel_scaffold1011:29355-34512(+) / protein_length=511 / sequence_SO=supercontig / SO=protein_coding / is_pseudo=false
METAWSTASRVCGLCALSVGVATVTWLGISSARKRGSAAKRKRRREEAGAKSKGSFCALVGNTPLVKLEEVSKDLGIELFGKAEFLNPGGSVKDRVAVKIIEVAEEQGKLKKGGTIFEGTSGSTGISLALAGNCKGYKTVIFVPNDQAKEKIQTLEAIGAEVRLCDTVGIVDEEHFVNAARREAQRLDPRGEGIALFSNQFENLANCLAHIEGTGEEIWEQTGGDVDFFVSGAGTGGTIAGVALCLKKKKMKSSERVATVRGGWFKRVFGGWKKKESAEGQKKKVNDDVGVILSDPQGSALAGRVRTGTLFNPWDKEGHRKRISVDTIVEGIGLNRLTANFQLGLPLIDHAFSVSDREAVAISRYLVLKEGLFLGSSAAVNVAAVVKGVKTGVIPPGSRVVTILCDSGVRHLSKLYSVPFLQSRKDAIWPVQPVSSSSSSSSGAQPRASVSVGLETQRESQSQTAVKPVSNEKVAAVAHNRKADKEASDVDSLQHLLETPLFDLVEGTDRC